MVHGRTDDVDAGGLTIRTFVDPDLPAVVELLRTAFGTWPQEIDSMSADAFFRWKHEQCPFGESLRVVALDGARVVGFVSLLPWRLRFGERVVPTMRGTDIAVHPDYRRHGASLALIEAIGAERERLHPDAFGFTWANPNKLSFSRTIKAGSDDAGALPAYVSVHVPTRLRGPFGHARRRVSSYPPIEAPLAADVLAPGVDARLLSRSSRHRPRLETIKDVEYLRWRYGRLGEYRALTLGDGEGLAIFRAYQRLGYRVVDVCELLIAPERRRTARKLLRAVRRACATELVTASFRSPSFAAACGYLRAPGGAVVTARMLRENVTPDPRDRDAWALSLGDLELI
ncbi:MAG TPA: GNAT family N-acetyltransferase [Solirubrobacteraceae bacterium]|jgi:GNAT superfamily N-acetyltransferase|nr:GNAT family N-acetyltransferase [Solirubrobacteraceae bacterium]